VPRGRTRATQAAQTVCRLPSSNVSDAVLIISAVGEPRQPPPVRRSVNATLHRGNHRRTDKAPQQTRAAQTAAREQIHDPDGDATPTALARMTDLVPSRA
jgi:hypothetical protein